MRSTLIAAVAIALLAGCSTYDSVTQRIAQSITPYRITVVQGNFVSKEAAAQMQAGMSRAQVRQLLGTPLLSDMFHADRWDYLFYFKRGSTAIVQQRDFIVHFEMIASRAGRRRGSAVEPRTAGRYRRRQAGQEGRRDSGSGKRRERAGRGCFGAAGAGTHGAGHGPLAYRRRLQAAALPTVDAERAGRAGGEPFDERGPAAFAEHNAVGARGHAAVERWRAAGGDRAGTAAAAVPSSASAADSRCAGRQPSRTDRPAKQQSAGAEPDAGRRPDRSRERAAPCAVRSQAATRGARCSAGPRKLHGSLGFASFRFVSLRSPAAICHAVVESAMKIAIAGASGRMGRNAHRNRPQRF